MEKINHRERRFLCPTLDPNCPIGAPLPVPPQRSEARGSKAAAKVAGRKKAA